MWFKKREEITENWLLEKDFKKIEVGSKFGFETTTKYGKVVRVYPYLTESDWDFFWTVDERLQDSITKFESHKIESVLNNY